MTRNIDVVALSLSCSPVGTEWLAGIKLLLKIKDFIITPANDWPIKQCLALVASLLVFLLCLIGLSILNFDIPLLRQIAGFAFLTFVPGILLLRILRIHNLNIIESYLYAVGLSLALIMLIGVLLNFTLPPLGFEHPLTLLPVVIALSIATILLVIIAYIRDKNFQLASFAGSNNSSPVPGKGSRVNPYLLALLLPFLQFWAQV